MTSIYTVSGLTVPAPVTNVIPSVTGLVAWSYFGSTFSRDNTNIAPGGAAFVNIGSGPEAIAANYIRCWYNASIRTAWKRGVNGSNGAVTLIAVGRATISSASTQALIGDARIFVSPKQVETANGSVPSVSAYRSNVAGPSHTITSALTWRAYAVTEPASGVSGTTHAMDLTAGTETTAAKTGVSSVTGTDNYMSFGTVEGNSTGSKRMDIAFGAIVTGRQMTLTEIEDEIMGYARVDLAARGITGI